MLNNIFVIIMIVLLISYIIASESSRKQNVKTYKELLEMNKLLIEQNTEIRKHNSELTKANQNLNRVIVHVCSKSVRDRNVAKKEEREGAADDESDPNVEKQGDES